MKTEIGTCTECGETVEYAISADNPHFCTNCRSVDTIRSEDE